MADDVTVEVDQEVCIGAGQCEALADQVFEVGDDGLSHVLRQPTDDELDRVRSAVDACPTSAISLREP